MTIDDLNQFVNEESIRGDLARELLGVISDYQAGTISLDDKNQLVEQIGQAYQNSELANDEKNVRWLAGALSLVVSVA